MVIPVSEKSLDYAKLVYSKFNKIENKFDNSDESLGKKIRKWKNLGIPNIIVVGEDEKLEHQKSGKICYILNNNNIKEKIILN